MNFSYISDYICDNEGCQFEQIESSSRKRELVQVKHLIMYMAKKHTDLSLDNIGSRFAYGSSHANVLNAIKSIQNLYDTDVQWRSKINMYNAYFGGLYIPFIPRLPDKMDLKLMRESIGITPTEVNKETKISRSHLRSIEKGDINLITYMVIKRILDFYISRAIENGVPIITY